MSERSATVGYATHQKETKNDTSDEQPPSDVKWHCYTVIGLRTVVEDLVRPLFGGQHSDGRENIQDVDKKVLEHNDVEPHVPRGGKGRIRVLQISGCPPSGTDLDLMPHPLSVNSLVSMKSNCRRGRTLSIRRPYGEEIKGGCMHLVVGDLFTFPPRTVTTHSWQLCLLKRARGVRGEPVALLVFKR